jgi:hypothetical protein
MSKKDFEDDGRIIANMSFIKENPAFFGFSTLGRRKKAKKAEKIEISKENIKMTKKETRSFIYSSVLAGLAITGVFVVGAYLFILFCIHIWFR